MKNILFPAAASLNGRRVPSVRDQYQASNVKRGKTKELFELQATFTQETESYEMFFVRCPLSGISNEEILSKVTGVGSLRKSALRRAPVSGARAASRGREGEDEKTM